MRTFRELRAYRTTDLQAWLDRHRVRIVRTLAEPEKPAEQLRIADPAVEAVMTRQAWRRRLGERAATP